MSVEKVGLRAAIAELSMATDLINQARAAEATLMDDSASIIDRAKAAQQIETLKTSDDYQSLIQKSGDVKTYLDTLSSLNTTYMKSITLHTTGTADTNDVLKQGSSDATLYTAYQILNNTITDALTMNANFGSSDAMTSIGGVDAQQFKDAAAEYRHSHADPSGGGSDEYYSNLDTDLKDASGITYKVHKNDHSQACANSTHDYDVSLSGKLSDFAGKVKGENLVADNSHPGQLIKPADNVALDALQKYLK